jgi:hypothetical protein
MGLQPCWRLRRQAAPAGLSDALPGASAVRK